MSASGGTPPARPYSERTIDSAYGAEDTQAMTLQTQVSIYGVDETGATNARLGSGTLIDPVLVLLHPPLSRRLVGGEISMRLRVGTASTGTEPGIVEVIDGGDIHVATNGDREPLVALELLQPASAPIEPLFPAGDDAGDLTDAVVQYLASLPDSSHTGRLDQAEPLEPTRVRRDPDNSDAAPWCRIWPGGPGCP